MFTGENQTEALLASTKNTKKKEYSDEEYPGDKDD
jgi:hypothetical protein